MKAPPMQIRRSPLAQRGRERGVVLIFALIALVILLIGAAAMMASMNSSLFAAGNYGFKRDLTTQGERALNTVLTVVSTGALATEALRQTDNKAQNYRASIITDTNPQGLPNALLSTAAFDAIGVASNDITLADAGVTVRYLVDRLCVAGTTTVSTANCTVAGNVAPTTASSSEAAGRAEDSSVGGVGAIKPTAVYRVSIRVTGPRNTQSFFQATFTI